MALRTDTLTDILACDVTLSDYDFWRALRTIETELYDRSRQGKPVPIELIYAKRIISTARTRRGAVEE